MTRRDSVGSCYVLHEDTLIMPTIKRRLAHILNMRAKGYTGMHFIN